MKKKRSNHTASTYDAEREKLRKQTAYSSPRSWTSMVLTLSAVLSFLGGIVSLIALQFMLAAVCLASGIGSLITIAIVGAVFDIADASLAARRDEAARIAREALAEARRREAEFQQIGED